jgi:uncharacterized oxidoreductase
MKTTGNTILVTGGSSGIGRELAQRFHALGNTVIVTGRRKDMLDVTVGGREAFFAYELDMDDSRAVGDFARQVAAEHPGLNVLINNAGVMPFEDLGSPGDLAKAEAVVTTNLLGPIRLTYALVKHLSGQADAAIVNVSSGLAFVPLVSAPTYSATKAALHSLSIAWRQQLAGRVEVIELAPPAVQTDLTPGQRTREGYMPLDEFMAEVMDLFDQKPTPREINVGRVLFLRNAESEGRFPATFAAVNG